MIEITETQDIVYQILCYKCKRAYCPERSNEDGIYVDRLYLAELWDEVKSNNFDWTEKNGKAYCPDCTGEAEV